VILQKFEIIRRLSESGKSQSVVRVRGTLEHQMSMISRNRRANYNCLWHQVNVWRSFQVTDIKTAYISAVGQGFGISSAFKQKPFDKRAFSDGWWWKFKEPAAEIYIQI